MNKTKNITTPPILEKETNAETDWSQKPFTEDPASEGSNILVWFGSLCVLPSPWMYCEAHLGTVGVPFYETVKTEGGGGPFREQLGNLSMKIKIYWLHILLILFYYQYCKRPNTLKGLSYEIDFENVDENWQILALTRAAAGF